MKMSFKISFKMIWCLQTMPIDQTFRPAFSVTWWRHQMETYSALLAICAGNSPVPGEFPAQRPVTESFDVYFDLSRNKPFSKQWWGWWFERLSCPLWRHCNGNFFKYQLQQMSHAIITNALVKLYGLLNTLRARQNGHHFAEDMFKCIFLNENLWILIEISLTFVPKGSINNNPALFQIMAWRRPGDKPLSEPMMVSSLTHICITLPQWVNFGELCDEWPFGHLGRNDIV